MVWLPGEGSFWAAANRGNPTDFAAFRENRTNPTDRLLSAGNRLYSTQFPDGSNTRVPILFMTSEAFCRKRLCVLMFWLSQAFLVRAKPKP
jgi:hypothetical protein